METLKFTIEITQERLELPEGVFYRTFDVSGVSAMARSEVTSLALYYNEKYRRIKNLINNSTI